MLPKPRNATLKETNRILLPYTLTKKPSVSKPANKPTVGKPKSLPSVQPGSVKSKPSTVLSTNYGSDEEEDDTGTSSFFSFGESSKSVASIKPQPRPVSQPLTTAPNKLSSGLPSVTPSSVVVNQVMSQTKPQPAIPETSQFDSTAPLNFGPSPSHQDAPLAFKPSDQVPSSQDAPLAFSKPMHPSQQYSYQSSSQYTESQMYAAPYGYEYNQPYEEEDDPPAFQQGGDSGEGQSAEGVSDLAADKEFQRLMGKRNVGRESINMVEIAADEQIGPTNHLDWMKKNLTEEKEYRVKLKKEQLPSGQQKRKHQITFLAHQAKERELELKTNWANNRQSRKQTQMKYGF